MGKPTSGSSLVFPPEHIGRVKVSRGTETSQYPEEKKETSIPKVVASEMGTAQTSYVSSLEALRMGGCRTDCPESPDSGASYKDMR